MSARTYNTQEVRVRVQPPSPLSPPSPPDCLLGPVEEELKKDAEGDGAAQKNLPHIPIHSHPNAFHVWDQDEVIIPMLMHLEESPPISPMMAGLPYMPSFFPSTVNITSPPYAHHIRRESQA